MDCKGMTFGILKEILPGERRVAVTPETARELIEKGARVLVETGAGKGAFFKDPQYSENGAEIISDAGTIYEKSDVFLKVKEPVFNDELGKHEAELLPPNSALVSFLHPANPANHDMVNLLAERGITSYTLDGIPRISRAQKMDVLTAMSTVAGYKAVTLAADRLLRFIPMMPTAFGVINPAQFLVIGTGVAGLQAVGTARRMGAKVKSLDIRSEANDQAKSLGAEVLPFKIPRRHASGKGGYAKRLTEKWYKKEREEIKKHLENVDVLILTALVPGEEAPMLVDREMVEMMKNGSVIVDVAIDQGGNCELTQAGKNHVFNNITINGIKNIPASLSIDSTWMFSASLKQFLDYIMKDGKPSTCTEDEIIRGTLVTHEGAVVHSGTLKAMGK